MYVYEAERVGDKIVRVLADEYPFDPRKDNATASSFYGDHRRYTIGDGKPPSDEEDALQRGGIRLLYRWLRRYKGVVAFTKVGVYDHSGTTYYTVPLDPPSRGAHPQDPQGWDSGVVGYAYITRESLEEFGISPENAAQAVEAEVKEWGDWASGNVWMYEVIKPCPLAEHEDDTAKEVADCPHSEVIDSCGGYIGEPEYAMAEGRAAA